MTNNGKFDRVAILFFRFTMAWTFLYAASHQVFNPKFSVAGFLNSTKTFHALYTQLATPQLDPILTFLVSYGHLLIGVSLLLGLFVRVSSVFGVLLMLMYWTAHMDFPYISDTNNFIVDFHIVYAGVLIFLFAKHAGHVFGLDAVAARIPAVENSRVLAPLVA